MDGTTDSTTESTAPERVTTLRRVELPYLHNHTSERLAKHDHQVKLAYLSKVGIKSNIPSGLICSGFLVAGAVSPSHIIGLFIAGGMGVGLNALSMRNSILTRRQELTAAESALFDLWPDDLPPQMDTAPQYTYTNAEDAWNAFDALRVEFPELAVRPPGLFAAAREHLGEWRARRHADREPIKDLSYGVLHGSLMTVLAKTPMECFPVGAELDPILRDRLERFARVVARGTVEGSLLDVHLPSADGGVTVARFELLAEPVYELIAYRRSNALVTAKTFSYPDPKSGWEALDAVRALRAEAPADGGEAPYLFPELREAFPPPSDEEMDQLEAVLEARSTGAPVPAVKFTSVEAQVRANPDAPDYVGQMYATIGAALNTILQGTTDEAFPVTNPMHPELDERLAQFAAKVGVDAEEGCVFDVSLPREDGGYWVVRYDFPGDGQFGVDMFPLEDLQKAVVAKQMEDLSVPSAPELAYESPESAWSAIDQLRKGFPEVDAAVRQVLPDEQAARTGEEALEAASFVLGICVQQLVNRSTVENLDERLATLATTIAKGAVPGTALTITLGTSVRRYSVGEAGSVEATRFTPEGVVTEGAVATELNGASQAAPARQL